MIDSNLYSQHNPFYETIPFNLNVAIQIIHISREIPRCSEQIKLLLADSDYWKLFHLFSTLCGPISLFDMMTKLCMSHTYHYLQYIILFVKATLLSTASSNMEFWAFSYWKPTRLFKLSQVSFSSLDNMYSCFLSTSWWQHIRKSF